MDQIQLKNMAFYGYHGNLAEENTLGQKFFVDVILKLDLTKAGLSDNLEDTVNYAAIYEQVKSVMEAAPCRLLERVATLIADQIWEHNHGVVGISVTIRKPEAPIPGILDYAEVTINRGTV